MGRRCLGAGYGCVGRGVGGFRLTLRRGSWLGGSHLGTPVSDRRRLGSSLRAWSASGGGGSPQVAMGRQASSAAAQRDRGCGAQRIDRMRPRAASTA